MNKKKEMLKQRGVETAGPGLRFEVGCLPGV